MPGPCFSWAKSMSFKAKSITFKSESSSEISYESRSGSFSSTPLRSEHPKTPPRRSHGCTQGCTPSIANLKEMLQGTSTLLGSHRSSSCSGSTCVSPSENDAYIHQTKNGDYMYRASTEKAKNKNKSFLKQYSFNSTNPPPEVVKKREVGKSRENLCIVKGCCECSMHSCDGGMVPRHHGSLTPKCVCLKCGEAFLKPEALELHQVVRHAVSELERGNSSLNVIEIIFKTSWLLKGAPVARIERILKIDNSSRNISDFHSYRDMVKRAASDEGMQHERCLADGNELLRFYGSSFTCSLGTNGSTNLCSLSACNVCSVIRWGFELRKERGIYTTATSGKAHEVITTEEKENWTGKHAMLVCRVIAGRIYRTAEKSSRFNDPSCLPYGYDSISRGLTTNLENLTIRSAARCVPISWSFETIPNGDVPIWQLCSRVCKE